MPLSEAEVQVVRSWVGNSPTDDDLDDRYDRLGSVEATIRESLRVQLTALILEQPTRVTLPSGLSVDYSAGVKALQDWMSTFEKTGIEGAAPSALVTKLSRLDPR